jgi:hypothetical protein
MLLLPHRVVKLGLGPHSRPVIDISSRRNKLSVRQIARMRGGNIIEIHTPTAPAVTLIEEHRDEIVYVVWLAQLCGGRLIPYPGYRPESQAQ